MSDDIYPGGGEDTEPKPLPTQVKNDGLIEAPSKRKAVNDLIVGAGLVLGTVMVVDLATPAFDLSAWTEPIFVGYAYISAAFGVAVTRPNYPTF